MIKVDGNSVSESYAKFCAPSWSAFNLRYYSAVTPDTLHLQSGLTFGTRANGRELTDTEKACFYSQYNLWVKSVKEKVPILILEHDAFLKNPEVINYNPNLMVQYFGQHSMEAVLYHPQFCNRLVNHCAENAVTGPMNLVDNLLGFTRIGEQSRYATPHARYQGQAAPVKSVLDPYIGTTVDHDGSTADRLNKDADLFKLVDISNNRSLNPENFLANG